MEKKFLSVDLYLQQLLSSLLLSKGDSLPFWTGLEDHLYSLARVGFSCEFREYKMIISVENQGATQAQLLPAIGLFWKGLPGGNWTQRRMVGEQESTLPKAVFYPKVRMVFSHVFSQNPLPNTSLRLALPFDNWIGISKKILSRTLLFNSRITGWGKNSCI